MNLTASVIVSKAIVLAGLSLAVGWDLSSRTIPNTLVLTVGGGGLLFLLVAAQRHTIWISIGTAGALFVVLRLLASAGTIGGGDAKLLAAVALGQPAAAVLSILLAVSLAGGVLAAFYLIRDRVRRSLARQIATARVRPAEMPYAPAILAGVVWHELWDLAT